MAALVVRNVMGSNFWLAQNTLHVDFLVGTTLVHIPVRFVPFAFTTHTLTHTHTHASVLFMDTVLLSTLRVVANMFRLKL